MRKLLPRILRRDRAADRVGRRAGHHQDRADHALFRPVRRHRRRRWTTRIKLYVKQNGDTVAGKKIEFIRKDTGGIAPDVAKRLAQELVVRDKVDILAGFVLTPNALAAGDVSAEAKKFMVVMNAATSIITTKSPYMARTSLTIAAAQRDARRPGPPRRAA